MSSSQNIHGQIVRVEGGELIGVDALMFEVDTEDTHTTFFIPPDGVPAFVHRLRTATDQLAAIYYKRTAPGVMFPAPNLAVLEQEGAEHQEKEGRCSVPHGQGECPDCPSHYDHSDEHQAAADARREMDENR